MLAMLAGLDPEAELVARLALNGLAARCRGDRAWMSRVAALRSSVTPTVRDLTRVLRRVAAVEREIVAALIADQDRG